MSKRAIRGRGEVCANHLIILTARCKWRIEGGRKSE